MMKLILKLSESIIYIFRINFGTKLDLLSSCIGMDLNRNFDVTWDQIRS